MATPEIRLADGVHYLDNTQGNWVLRDGDHVIRPVRTKLDTTSALRAVAEAVLQLSRHGLSDGEWRGLNNPEGVLIQAEPLDPYWFVVMEFDPLDVWYCYLIAPDGEPRIMGSISRMLDTETPREQRVNDMLVEAKRTVERA